MAMLSFARGGIRQLKSERDIYLTFDDGPDPESTPQVLDILDANTAKASFFVVAKFAEKNPDLLREIRRRGHAVGNHSADHTYHNFFASSSRLRDWVENSEKRISNIIGESTVGFRPPAGVVTPPLIRVLEDLEMPLFLWSHRFFDTQRPFTNSHAQSSLKSLQPGSIILLHDRQRPARLSGFLRTLSFYLQSLKSRGLDVGALARPTKKL